MACHRFPRALAALAAAASLLLALCAPALGEPVVQRLPHKFTVPEPFVVGKSYSFTFRFFDSADPGVTRPVWQETKGYKVPTQRLVSHELGSVRPFTNEGTALAPVDFGVQLWVQVSSGAKLIGGRTRLSPIVPYALHSESSALGSVTTETIADGAVTDVDIAPDAAIADGKLAQITSAGKVADSALSPNVVLTDNAQTLTGLKTFNPLAGDVPFAVDPSKSGLVANLYAARAQSAGAVDGKTLADLDARYGLAASSLFTGGVVSYSVRTVNAWPSGVGPRSSITIGDSGAPVLSTYLFSDARPGGLLILHCGNAACSSGNAATLADPGGWTGQQSSISIGTDGFPIVSYYESGSGLKFMRCGDDACSSGNAIAVVGTVSDLSPPTSVTVGADGLPIIVYERGIAHCGNADCSSGNTIASRRYPYASIMIGADALPIVAGNLTGNHVEILHCLDSRCSEGPGSTTRVILPDARQPSIAIGADGLPVIAFYAWSTRDLKIMHCGNATCSAGNSISTADATDEVGDHASITIGADGRPVVAYYDATNKDLKVLRCGNATCDTGNAIDVVDSAGDVGQYPSITVGADGLPVMSYYDATNGALKVAKMNVRPLGRR